MGVSKISADIAGVTATSNALIGHSDAVASLMGMSKLYADIAAPWADLARLSEKLLGRLELEGRFENERTIWLPGDDEESADQLVGQLVVPAGEGPRGAGLSSHPPHGCPHAEPQGHEAAR
jgi:hypothetical protein